jgi:hypothetical protein
MIILQSGHKMRLSEDAAAGMQKTNLLKRFPPREAPISPLRVLFTDPPLEPLPESALNACKKKGSHADEYCSTVSYSNCGTLINEAALTGSVLCI